MNRDLDTGDQIRQVLILSFCLLGFVFLTPNPGNVANWAFISVARSSVWFNLLDWAAVWCSLKMIVLCLALFLALDAVGSLLMRRKRKPLAFVFFSAIVIPFVGLLAGGYYLLKALF